MEIAFDQLVLVVVAFVLGGILKGATGVGAPFLAVPIMALMVNVPFAVAVFLIPNIIANAWQTWRYRAELTDRRFAFTFAGTGVLGAALGTAALARFSGTVLMVAVSLVVLAYVVFRLVNPEWVLSRQAAQRTVGPVGSVGGFFQGAVGLSGPVTITYMTAVGLPRSQFIFTISLYLLAMTLIQLPVQIAFGIMTVERFSYGALALAPLAFGMFVGDILGRHISSITFDRIVLAVLTLLALRLLADAFV